MLPAARGVPFRTMPSSPPDSFSPHAPPADPANALARGIARMFGEAGESCLFEFTLRNGRRADVIALTPNGQFTIVEIKSSVADYRSDRKWADYLPFCDFFYFGVSESFPQDLIPETCGLIVADAYGGVILRAAPEDPLNAARRRALMMQFAHGASRRLMRQLDPVWVVNAAKVAFRRPRRVPAG